MKPFNNYEMLFTFMSFVASPIDRQTKFYRIDTY